MNPNTKNLRSFVAILFSLGITACGEQTAISQNYAPPANSPLARKIHPRIFFSQDNLPALRQRLKTLYHAEFQRYVDELDAHFDDDPATKEGGPLFMDTKNYAFLYLIDPAEMREFRFGQAREQYGRKAFEHAMQVKTITRGDKHLSALIQSEKGGYQNLALAVAYDWTFPMLSPDEKRAIADGLIQLYDSRDKDANPGKYQKLSNQVTGYIHAGSAAALAFWGDELGPQYVAKANEMLDFFNAVFLERSLGVGDKIFEGTGWSEGASYYMLGMTNLCMLAGAASSALGENLFFKNGFLRYNAPYVLYNTLPLKLRGNYYLSRHDTNSLQEVIGHDISRILAIMAGALRKDDPDMAGLSRWMITQGGYGQLIEDFKYFDPRVDYLFFKFLWGSEDVEPRSPAAVDLPLTYKLGLGQFVMKSSFDAESSTHIIFWAPKYWYSPHAHLDLSSFTIYKHGSLALDSGIGKNADDMPRGNSSRQPVFHNILGLYDPAERDDDGFNFMEFSFSDDRGSDHWQDAAFQSGGRNVVGEVKAFESGRNYDFIDYDYSNAYKGKQSKTKFAHRRFVYLRGPENQEFVVVHDVVDSPLQKRWLLHTAFEPAISNDEINVINNFDVAHGRMLVKSVLPEQKEIVKIGGTGKWFVDANERIIESKGPYTEWGAYWVGSYRIEIRSAQNEFLTVMQIGDSGALQTMAPLEKIESTNCSGALINSERLVIFNKKPGAQRTVSYQLSGQKTIAHLVTGLLPNTPATVDRNGTLQHLKTSPAGTLFFEDNPGGTAKYKITL